MLYKEDWSVAQEHFTKWWHRDGFVLWLTALRPQPHEDISQPAPAITPEQAWFDAPHRISWTEYHLAHTEFLADSFPQADIQIGPGSLATFLGANPIVDWNTVWYRACITDPGTYGSIHLIPENNYWLDLHLKFIDEALNRSRGRWLVGVPDLIENMDTLAALRGDSNLFFDLVERPEWVYDRLAEINEAFFQAYDIFYARIKDPQGGSIFNPFNIWGPGKTVKVQCDISASLSPKMFRKFVAPHLDAQCKWLNHSLYHLDGTTCLQHLDTLLEIDSIDAIEWTPQDQSQPTGGDPHWYDLYQKIKSAGKSIQVIGVEADELVPLLDAIGPSGTYVMMNRSLSMDRAEELLKAVEPYQK
jgi:hypothetical protein